MLFLDQLIVVILSLPLPITCYYPERTRSTIHLCKLSLPFLITWLPLSNSSYLGPNYDLSTIIILAPPDHLIAIILRGPVIYSSLTIIFASPDHLIAIILRRPSHLIIFILEYLMIIRLLLSLPLPITGLPLLWEDLII